MGKQDTNVQKKKNGFRIVYSLHEKSWEQASLSPKRKAVKAAKEGKGIGEVLRVSQERCWSSQNSISYLQLNSAMLPKLIKPFTAVVGEAGKDSKTFWFSLAASSRSPGNLLIPVTHSPSQKAKSERSEPSSSCSVPNSR